MRSFLIVLLSLALQFSCKKSNPTPVVTVPVITGFDCGTVSFSATPTAGIAYNGTVTVHYNGGNGKTYTAGTSSSSTGVTGLTVTLQAGTLASGSGDMVYTISGLPSAAGNAGFDISFGTYRCSVLLPVAENTNFVQYGTPFPLSLIHILNSRITAKTLSKIFILLNWRICHAKSRKVVMHSSVH